MKQLIGILFIVILGTLFLLQRHVLNTIAQSASAEPMATPLVAALENALLEAEAEPNTAQRAVAPTNTPWPTNTPRPLQPTSTPWPTNTPRPTQTPWPTATPTPEVWTPSARAFIETFDGNPAAPKPWIDPQWDVVVHSRDVDTWYELEPVAAQHASDCGPPPASHSVTQYEDMVFQCKNHVMTAIKAEAYGLIYLTPNQLVDFSNGEAVIRFDTSTARQSSRDWIDVWITPYEHHLIYPLESWLPDLTGKPRHTVHVRLTFSWDSIWYAEVTNGFETRRLEGTTDSWQSYDAILDPDYKRRDTWELRISHDHLTFGLPDYDLWYVDEPLTPWLSWDSGVVQFGHHSYNPEKSCDFDGSCHANTWHWDNIIVDPAIPFTIIKSTRRYADATQQTVQFERPAPADAHLRFAGIGNNLQVSFDNGTSWQVAKLQGQTGTADEAFKSFWMPIPTGTQSVQFQGADWWGGPWHVRDVSIWKR